MEVINDFMGLYPIIEDNDKKQELRSFTPIQYTPKFSYAFLCIPSNMCYRFRGYLRQLLHEFFHYVPTKTREERNHILIHMCASFIAGNTASKEVVEMIADFLDYHYRRLGHDSLLFQDSMSFISTMRVVLNRVNIQCFLENKVQDAFDYQNLPTKLAQINHLVAYTYFLREIRSDISMIELMNAQGVVLGLKEYIQIMANEPDWATLPAKEASEESILRLGYMSEWIKQNIMDDIDLDVQDIINQFISGTSDPILRQKYENMYQYINEYYNEMNIIECCRNELDNLVAKWRQDNYLNKIKKSCFWKSFLKLYNFYTFEENQYSCDEAQFDYGMKLFLMSIPYYKKQLATNE